MWKYVVKRVFLALLTIFVITAITFFTMNAIPGGPFDAEKAPDPAVKAVLEKRFNLDKPVGEQFILYLNNMLHGDFGISLKNGRDIASTITESFSISAKLGLTAVACALILGLFLGCIAALTRNRWPDRLIIFFTTLFVAVPSFVLATLLLLVFCLKLGWFPVWNVQSPSYVLPVIALALYPMAYITRLTRSSMLDVLGQDYIRTARAKGVSGKDIIFGHALKNSLIPVITYFGPMLAYIVTGSLVVEQIFAVPGIGRAFVNSITGRDYPLIMGTTIVLAVLIVVMNLVSDILYKVVDPRITLE